MRTLTRPYIDFLNVTPLFETARRLLRLFFNRTFITAKRRSNFGSRKNDSVINVQKVNFELLQSLCFKNYSMLFVKACMREQREQAAVLLLCKEKSQMCFYSQEEALASKTLNGVI